MLFCKHQWETITDRVTESPFEVATRMTEGSTGRTIPHQMCSTKRKHILVVACKVCGKIKKFVTTVS
jgi:hypothetical protein